MKNNKSEDFYGIQFYPQDYIADQTLLVAADVIKEKINFNTPVKLVSSSIQQSFKSIENELFHLNIQPTTIDEIYSGIKFIPMQTGTTFGYIKYMSAANSANQLTTFDIPILDELPLDLSVVSGVITTVIQDAGSHINLKSKERNTPNLVLRDQTEIEKIRKLDGKPVKLIVSDENYKIEISTEKEVKDFFNKKMKQKKWTQIKNGNLTEAISFDSLAENLNANQITKTSSSYGGKASKLAFLAHRNIAGIGSEIQKILGYRLTPIGFAIPVAWYFQFLNENTQLKLKLQKLVNSENSQKNSSTLTSTEKQKLINEIQEDFLKTPFPTNLIEPLSRQIEIQKNLNQKYFPLSEVKKIKVRSSANAEDIQDFDGAGLHSSYSANMNTIGNPSDVCQITTTTENGVITKEEISPETVICAIKGVYSSLWNKRAIEERSFARIDQSNVAMGIAVNNNYDFRKKSENIKEIANAVVVTRVINSKGIYGYRASFNNQDNLVTNPTPGTQSEILLATFINRHEKPQFSFLQFAKETKDSVVRTSALLPNDVYEKIIKTAQSIEYNYCLNTPSYYPNRDCELVVADVNKERSLDMEFKIYSNGTFLLKQVREFSGN